MRLIKIRGEEVEIYEPWELKKHFPSCGKVITNRGYQKGKTRYVDQFLTFDIETTTHLPDSYVADPEKTDERPFGFMYCWQMCLGEHVAVGRDWESWLRVMQEIRNFYRIGGLVNMVVYVHFLSYETSFLKGIIDIEKMFAKDKRKPMKFIWNGFEFRCSWFLSNMSLAKFCENTPGVVHKKMSGEDFDYSKERYPSTELTDDELGYCYCDVKGLHECIEGLLRDDSLASIPLTSTGYVRRDARRAMSKNPLNRVNFRKCRLDLRQYKLVNDCFRGGDTHASRFYAGKKLRGLKSRDFKSSYPYWMMEGYYPVSPLVEYVYDGDQEAFEKLLKKYCVMFRVEVFDLKIRPDVPDPYISLSMLDERMNVTADNGRVLTASYASFAVTEIDWGIIKQKYTFELNSWNVKECYYSKRGKLPDELREVVMEYFMKKTELDGIKEKKYEYTKAKNRLNALYGMLVAAIVHVEHLLSGAEWKKPKKITDADIEKALNEYYDGWNNFLTYQWGIYVTAHARNALNNMRNVVGTDAVYWDTDSLKYFSKPEYEAVFDRYNEMVKNQGYNASDSKGKFKYLGTFETEPGYKEFKTLGAKKYGVVNDKDEKEITVAGMGKEKGLKALVSESEKDGCDDFLDKFEIGTTLDDVGRTVSYYHDGKGFATIDLGGGPFLISKSNVGVVETSYTFGVTNEYYELIFGRERLGNVKIGKVEK